MNSPFKAAPRLKRAKFSGSGWNSTLGNGRLLVPRLLALVDLVPEGERHPLRLGADPLTKHSLLKLVKLMTDLEIIGILHVDCRYSPTQQKTEK